MFREFYLLMKQQRKRGWRLEGTLNSLYLSKFCEKYNYDEYRFYLQLDDDGFSISHSKLIKGYDKQGSSLNKNEPAPVRSSHRYAQQADHIVTLMNTFSLHQSVKVPIATAK